MPVRPPPLPELAGAFDLVPHDLPRGTAAAEGRGSEKEPDNEFVFIDPGSGSEGGDVVQREVAVRPYRFRGDSPPVVRFRTTTPRIAGKWGCVREVGSGVIGSIV